MVRRVAVDTDFFKNWSRNMAYVLGFFAADGYMWKSDRGAAFFGFQITDRDLLCKTRTALNSQHKVATRAARKNTHQDSYRLQIDSKEMYQDLLNLGMTPTKSRTLAFPYIPKKYVSDFIRGYFDGDGNVYCGKHYAKDRGKNRWVFQSRFTSGSRQFLAALHESLQKVGIQRGFIYSKKRGYELVLSHRDSVALYRLMYNNASASLYLARKKEAFEDAIHTLYPYNMGT